MSKLPKPGEVFALEVSQGVDLLLRVVASLGETRCVVVTKHSGPTVVRAPASSRLFEVQPFAHHEWNRPLLGGWVSEAAPASVRSLGVVPVRAGEAERVLHPKTWVKLPKKTAELSAKVLPLCGWELLLTDARNQWRWDHQREVVLAEDAKREREKSARFKAALAAQGRRKASLQKRGVASLKRTRFFGAWKGVVPAPMIQEAEAVMREAVLSLEGKSPAQAARRLVRVVRSFNALDGRYGREFDTVDREDIMEAVNKVAFACGVEDAVFDESIDAEREF